MCTSACSNCKWTAKFQQIRHLEQSAACVMVTGLVTERFQAGNEDVFVLNRLTISRRFRNSGAEYKYNRTCLVTYLLEALQSGCRVYLCANYCEISLHLIIQPEDVFFRLTIHRKGCCNRELLTWLRCIAYFSTEEITDLCKIATLSCVCYSL